MRELEAINDENVIGNLLFISAPKTFNTEMLNSPKSIHKDTIYMEMCELFSVEDVRWRKIAFES